MRSLHANGSCSVCGGSLRPNLKRVRDADSGESFRVERCADCGLGHTRPVPEDIVRYYGPGYYGQRHSFTARRCAQRRVRWLEAATGRMTGALLDVGCGEGTFLQAAATRGFRVVGTELGAAADRARAAGVEVFASVADARERGPFDAATMWHTLEHFSDPRAIVTEVASALRGGGTFIVAVPNADGWQAATFGEHWFHLDVPRHLFHFGPRSLNRLLVDSGFRVERWCHQELEYDVFGWMQSALNAATGRHNVLFQAMSGRPVDSGFVPLAVHYVAGAFLAPAALAATSLSTLSRGGGTLVAIARRTSDR